MESEENNDKSKAILEFFGQLSSLSGPPPTELSDLSDGVAFSEILSEIAPGFFDPNTLARGLGSNWALKASNVRKLVRNFEEFLHQRLRKTSDLGLIKVTDIAKHAEQDAIIMLFELIAAAAVSCESNEAFVTHILSMGDKGQEEMKLIIESGLARMEDYNEDDASGADSEDEKEFVFGGSDDEGTFNNSGQDDNGTHGLFAESADMVRMKSEMEKLKSDLESAQQENKLLKNENAAREDEASRDIARLQEITQELQERLEENQTSLSSAESESINFKRTLEETSESLEEERQKNAQLADELEVANDKARQLHKAEATVLAYKKKLESVGVMTQQMQELETQTEGYLRQILTLEKENKEMKQLTKKNTTLETKVKELETSTSNLENSLQLKSSEATKLKSELSAISNAKRLLEDEVLELRQQSEASADLEDEGLSKISTGGANTAKLKEDKIRLESEVESLKAQLAEATSLQSSSQVAPSSDLQAELNKRDMKIKQLSRDKLKLEQYSKNTLAKFQEKYLVALQECKKQLKEKHEEREQLEIRAQMEKNAHKKEEQLLSSTIYELGISILQSKLSSSQG